MSYISPFRFSVFLCCLYASLTACAPQSVDPYARSSELLIETEIERLLSLLSLEEKINLVHANSKFSVAGVKRLGIPELSLSDGPHGVREEISRHSWESANWDNDYATYLPPLTAVAASWDTAVARIHGGVLGAEARDRGKDIILAPGVNLARLPTYGRNFEYFGEDPFLTATLVVPEIEAIQANDVAATVKHFALNTQELNRWGVDARPSERTLREVYLPAFEAAVKRANVWAVMGGYNRVYGTNANQSQPIIDILKDDWGFQGVLLTDWHVDINTKQAALNGLDLEMGTWKENYSDYFFADPLWQLIEQGEIPESVLDEKVRRILRLQISIGMMDPNRKSGARDTAGHHQAAQQIIEQGVVLLKNSKQLLPLDKTNLKRVVVLGPNANLAHGRGGGSSQVKSRYEITPLQGLREALGNRVQVDYLRVAPSNELPPIAGDFITTRLGGAGIPGWKAHHFTDETRQKYKKYEEWVNAYYQSGPEDQVKHLNLAADMVPLESGEHRFIVQGAGNLRLLINGEQVVSFSAQETEQRDYRIALAKDTTYRLELQYDGSQNFTLGLDAPGLDYSTLAEVRTKALVADAVFYFGGLSHAHDREGQDRAHMRLPDNQDEVIGLLVDANKNTIVSLIAGSPVEMPWINNVSTLVWGWYGGMHAGRAYARVLFGDVNPSGKMPFTLPKKYSDSAPIALNDYNEKESLYKEGVFIGYRWFEQKNIEPLFPFGYGLSYTTFELSDLQLPEEFTTDSEFNIAVTVKNSGKHAGAEVVQLYLGDEQSTVDRPRKELKGFAKVYLQPGEIRQVNIPVTQRDLAFWDVNIHGWKVEQGQFNVYVGTSSADIKLRGTFDYKEAR